MAAETVSAMRRIVLASLGVMGTWALLYSPLARLERKTDQLRQLHAWIGIYQLLTNIDGQLSGPRNREHPLRLDRECRRANAECVDLRARGVSWPDERVVQLALVETGRRGIARAGESGAPIRTETFEIETESGLGASGRDDPASRYVVVMIQDNAGRQSTTVTPRSRLGDVNECLTYPYPGLRTDKELYSDLQGCLLELSHPEYWAEIEPFFGALSTVGTKREIDRGINRFNPAHLKFGSDYLQKFEADAQKDFNEVVVLGIPVPAQRFVGWGPLILLLMALWALGPLIVRWTEAAHVGVDEEIPWIFAVRTARAGLRWRMLEGALLLTSGLWVVAPLAIGVLAPSVARESLGSWVSISAGGAGSVIFGLMALELRRLRGFEGGSGPRASSHDT